MSTMTNPTEEFDAATLASLYEETFRNFEEGTITEGRVVDIQKDRVIVDIGYKSEGVIPMNQFLPDELPTLALDCLLYTSPSPRDLSTSRMPSSA